jgi:hypothetical protein
MDIMKGLAREELENSIRIKKAYEDALKNLPKGALSRKKINGKEYYYLFYRESPKKVRSRYLGKLSDKEVKKYQEKIRKRREYERLVREAKQQIEFFRRVLGVRRDSARG